MPCPVSLVQLVSYHPSTIMTVRFLPFEALGILALVVGTNAWGQVGHQIVATIAQTQLHPLVRAHLCDILPAFTAYQSAWPANGPGGGQQ